VVRTIPLDRKQMALLFAINTAPQHPTESKQIIELLLDHGVDINAGDSSGVTPLHAAVRQGQVANADFLIAHGADVNAKENQGWSPLHLAASLNNGAMVSLLLSRHADVAVRDDKGLSPQRLTTSADVLAVFAQAGVPGAWTSPTAADALACEEVVRSGLWKGIRRTDGEPDWVHVPEDPRYDWDFQRSMVLPQDIVERVVHIHGQDYVLGVWWGKPHWVFVDDYPYFRPDSAASPGETGL
jgi:hypothetical protein